MTPVRHLQHDTMKKHQRPGYDESGMAPSSSHFLNDLEHDDITIKPFKNVKYDITPFLMVVLKKNIFLITFSKVQDLQRRIERS